MSPAVKFDEIARDYDYEQQAYQAAVDREWSRSLRLYRDQPEEEEEIIYRRTLKKSFARRVREWLIDGAGMSLEVREAIECLEDSLRTDGPRAKAQFPESVFQWLRGQKESLSAYLSGKYAVEIHNFLD